MSRRPGRPRVVFDCNVCVQAVAFADGPAAQALRGAESGLFQLFVSKATLRELRRVFAYDEIRAMSPNMTPARVAAFLERLAYRSTLIRRVPHVFDFARDPRDEPYLNLCVAAEADYLVTRDSDMLWLMTGRTPWCKEFRRTTHPLRVVDPATFLNAQRQGFEFSDFKGVD